MKTVIFASVHNAGRSQMAAAFFNKLADPANAREPSPRVQLPAIGFIRTLSL